MIQFVLSLIPRLVPQVAMNDSTYGLLCAFLLGLGQMCMFTGYDAQSFVVEPLLHSVNDRKPWTIDAHAGYYGTAVCCIVYTLANLAAPWVLGICGPKLTLVLGSATFTIYLASFFYVHYVPYYFTSALMGLGFALYYTGNGGYVTEHSTRETIERNSALTWAVGTCCMIVGGVVMLFTITPPLQMKTTIDMEIRENGTLAFLEDAIFEDTKSYREYSDYEIRLMYGAFALVSFLSNVIFAVIPSRPVQNSLAEMGPKTETRVGFVKQLVTMADALSDPRMLKLAPVFCLLGTTTSFWIVVYPTCLTFTKALSGHIYLPAYYSIVLGFGDMMMGLLISFLSKRVRNFGQKPTMVVGTVFHWTALVLVLLSTPFWSTNTPNDDPTLLIEPNIAVVLVIALLFGLADNCHSTSRTILAALALPSKRAQVFSISKFYQSLCAGIMMFISPFMSIPMHFALISLNLALSVYFFFNVADETRHSERKITLATRAATMASVHPANIRSILGQSEDKAQP